MSIVNDSAYNHSAPLKILVGRSPLIRSFGYNELDTFRFFELFNIPIIYIEGFMGLSRF